VTRSRTRSISSKPSRNGLESDEILDMSSKPFDSDFARGPCGASLRRPPEPRPTSAYMASAGGARKAAKIPFLDRPLREFWSMSGLFQRFGQGARAFGGQLRLMLADENGADGQRDDSDNPDHDHDRPGHVLHLVPKEIGRKAEDRRPREGHDTVGKQELQPRHAVRPGQDTSQAAQ